MKWMAQLWSHNVQFPQENVRCSSYRSESLTDQLLAFTYDFMVCISDFQFSFKLLKTISSTKPELTGTMLTSEVKILVSSTSNSNNHPD